MADDDRASQFETSVEHCPFDSQSPGAAGRLLTQDIRPVVSPVGIDLVQSSAKRAVGLPIEALMRRKRPT